MQTISDTVAALIAMAGEARRLIAISAYCDRRAWLAAKPMPC